VADVLAVRYRRSAGGVVYRWRGRRVEVCLIATAGKTRWQLPKGRIERGETREEAALREVQEETGLEGRIEELLGEISFRYVRKHRKRIHKRVVFFLMAYVDGSTDDHDDEVDEARFFAIEDALDRLTFESERDMVSRARAVLLPLAQSGG
jgi:8-oxo-dGTP pyrophosphatase MutT (NUDIX family)